MNKILLSVATLALIGVVSFGATRAFFSDTEVSAGNVFTAGSVSIEFDGIEHEYAYDDGTDPVDGYFETSTSDNIPFFSFNDMKPRDAGTLSFGLGNGANEAYVCGFIGGEEPAENPDLALWQNLNFYETDGDQVTPGSWIDLGTIAPDTTGNFAVDYCFGDWDGTSCDVDPGVDYNEAQLGSFGASLTLFAIQTRNNEGFSCDQLTFDGETPVYTPVEQPEVGASLSLYEAPNTCTTTLSSGASINSAITSATAGETICVGSGTYAGPIEMNKGVTLASVSGAAVTTIDGGVKITADGAVVKGFTVNAGVVPAEPNPVGFYVASGNNIEISSNQVDGTGTTNSTGVLVPTGASYTNVVVENNIFANLTRGMYTNPITSGVIDVHYNDFLATNAVGIAGFNGADVWRNEFSAPEALGVDGTYDSNPADVTENNFLVGADINVYAMLTNNVNAPNNFFNLGATSQVNNQQVGEVDFTPEAGAQYGHR